MIITNSRYALVGYFITSYPTWAHGIIVIYPEVLGLPNQIVNVYYGARWSVGKSEPFDCFFLVGILPCHTDRFHGNCHKPCMFCFRKHGSSGI